MYYYDSVFRLLHTLDFTFLALASFGKALVWFEMVEVKLTFYIESKLTSDI